LPPAVYPASRVLDGDVVEDAKTKKLIAEYAAR
jgi:hypothetical protein